MRRSRALSKAPTHRADAEGAEQDAEGQRSALDEVARDQRQQREHDDAAEAEREAAQDARCRMFGDIAT